MRAKHRHLPVVRGQKKERVVCQAPGLERGVNLPNGIIHLGQGVAKDLWKVEKGGDESKRRRLVHICFSSQPPSHTLYQPGRVEELLQRAL